MIKNLLRRTALRLLGRGEGSPYNVGLRAFFADLKRLGFSPSLIFDVGANHGRFTRSALSVFPNARCIMFEPQAHLQSEVADLIKSGAAEWRSIGLGDQCGTLPFTIHAHDHSSRFGMSAEEAAASGLRQIEVPISTLDQEIDVVPDLIKVDAEGQDLNVLRGATRALGQTEVFLVEVSVLGDGDNDLRTVHSFMDDQGYQLVQVTELNKSHSNGLLWLMEMAFIRRGSPILENAKSYW